MRRYADWGSGFRDRLRKFTRALLPILWRVWRTQFLSISWVHSLIRVPYLLERVLQTFVKNDRSNMRRASHLNRLCRLC